MNGPNKLECCHYPRLLRGKDTSLLGPFVSYKETEVWLSVSLGLYSWGLGLRTQDFIFFITISYRVTITLGWKCFQGQTLQLNGPNHRLRRKWSVLILPPPPPGSYSKNHLQTSYKPYLPTGYIFTKLHRNYFFLTFFLKIEHSKEELSWLSSRKN